MCWTGLSCQCSAIHIWWAGDFSEVKETLKHNSSHSLCSKCCSGFPFPSVKVRLCTLCPKTWPELDPISSLPWLLSFLSPWVSVPASGPWHWLLPLLEILFYISLQWTLSMLQVFPQMFTSQWSLHQPSYLNLQLLFRTMNLRHSRCSKHLLWKEGIIILMKAQGDADAAFYGPRPFGIIHLAHFQT